jgi:hypothetical protein
MVEEHKKYFDDKHGELLPYLDKIRRRINHQDYDCFLVVTGKERRGKSTLAAQIADYLSNGKLDINNICLDIDQFLNALKNSNKGDVIIFDEAGTNLYSREAMSTMNRMLTKAFMVSGLKNICIIICIPNFFSLDSYVRQHRLDLLFYVYERGKFKVYSPRRAREISIKGSKMKQIDVVKANTVGWFIKEFPPYVEKAYRAKEISFKLRFIKDVKQNIEGNYTLNKFSEVTGFTTMTLLNWIKDSKLEAKKYGGKWFIPKSEAERISLLHNKQSKFVKKAGDDNE